MIKSEFQIDSLNPDTFRSFLEDNAHTFPHIFKLTSRVTTDHPKDIYYGTKVRIEREGKYYLVPVIMAFSDNGKSPDHFLATFVKEAYKTLHLYQLTGKEKQDDKNYSEHTRMLLEVHKDRIAEES